MDEAEADAASGILTSFPTLPNSFERIARETMVHALVQGYWLQHVYMQECQAAAFGQKYRGRVTLSDGDELDEDALRKILESLVESASTGNKSEWFKIIPVDAVRWIEGYTPKLAGVLEKDILEKVRQVVRDSMYQGTTLKQRIDALKEAEPKIRAMAKNRVEAIARTEVTRADSMGRLIDMKSNPDVLGVEFSAILDDRTTEVCQARHGLIMRMDDPRLSFNTPPLHVNCRSILLPATIYEHPDGLLTSHEFDDAEPGKQRPEDIEAVRMVLEGGAEDVKAPSELVPEEMVRGVRQSVIDKLRGKRGHAKKPYEYDAETVKSDYARVGIVVTNEEAETIRSAIEDFSGNHYVEMKRAFKKQAQGLSLTESEATELDRYKQAIEYTKIAPVYSGKTTVLHRGIRGEGEYAKKLYSLAVGDNFDLEMASSFSSNKSVAKDFARYRGIILHIEENSWKNAPSIRGFSQLFRENEVLVSDQIWTVTKVSSDDAGFRHISIVRKQQK